MREANTPCRCPRSKSIHANRCLHGKEVDRQGRHDLRFVLAHGQCQSVIMLNNVSHCNVPIVLAKILHEFHVPGQQQFNKTFM